MVAVRARSGIGGASPLRGQSSRKKKFSFCASLLQHSSTSEYNRHRSIHHAISFKLFADRTELFDCLKLIFGEIYFSILILKFIN